MNYVGTPRSIQQPLCLGGKRPQPGLRSSPFSRSRRLLLSLGAFGAFAPSTPQPAVDVVMRNNTGRSSSRYLLTARGATISFFLSGDQTMWWVANKKWFRVMTPIEAFLLISCSLVVGLLACMLVLIG
jgi:hypothetical protein